tara:strand:- start:709 stop:1395 length:687 start_codon:yes stop_codon:yes gene_type:complete
MSTKFKSYIYKYIKKNVIYSLFVLIICNSAAASENYGDAMEWYNNQKSNMDPKYHYMIGLKAEKEGFEEKALRYFSLAVNGDYTPAQVKLSSYLEKSKNFKDNQMARMIYHRLSEKNYPKAALKLGWMFENSIGGNKDEENAFKFYKLAASREENEAYLYMANLSLNTINENSILEAIGYALIAKNKKVKGSKKFLEKLMKFVDNRNLSELEVLTLGLEFEIKKINPN